MKVTYVSHACLLIETGKSLVVTDPWFDGPAFCGQWNVFPKPVNSDATKAASAFLISHPHEDHLHEPTLRRLCRNSKKVFYPFYWYPETISWLRSLELGEIIEARSGRRYRLDDATTVTFIGAPGQNSIIVLESGGEVLVNVNDALHSEATSVIDVYVHQIKRRWPKIDVVFCGFGGASYYPNALHSSLKDDRAVARLREQLFVHNFCRIVRGLAPRTAVPFAADFVLLAEHQRWINEVRFPREEIADYYARYFGGSDIARTEVRCMYPGDELIDGVVRCSSPYRAQLRNGRLDHLIAVQYPEEVSAFCGPDHPRTVTIDEWRSKIASHLNSQVKFHSPRMLRHVRFSIHLRDLPAKRWLDVAWTGSNFEVEAADSPSPRSIASIETTTAVLEASMGNDWGGDILTIGYACDIDVLDQRNPASARLCLSLLTRYPRPKSYAFRYPVRTLDYLYQSTPMVTARLKNKIRSRLMRQESEDVMTSPHWLTGNLAAIRRASRLPELKS
jgi:L-ascorbate metabolism protein UlaG (beta-lactamase superfamily)